MKSEKNNNDYFKLYNQSSCLKKLFYKKRLDICNSTTTNKNKNK